MGRRRDRKPTLASTAACAGVEIQSVTVRDPYDGRDLVVAKNVRTHPLDHMAARGRLSAAQKAAGDRFLAIWDRSQIGGARAIDYSRLRVDVSFAHSGLDASVAAATDHLRAICRDIGKRAYRLLVLVIGGRMAVFDLARRLDGTVDDHEARHVSACLREALDDLADHFGVAKGAAKPLPPYERRIKPFVGKIDVEVQHNGLTGLSRAAK